MLSGLVEALRRSSEIAAREQGLAAPTQVEIQFVVTLFHMIEVAEPLFGAAMRRSAGLPGDEASRGRFRNWLLGVFADLLQAQDASRGGMKAVDPGEARMSHHPKTSRLAVPDIRTRKGKEKIVCLMAHSAPVATLLDPFVDLILVGDESGRMRPRWGPLYGFWP